MKELEGSVEVDCVHVRISGDRTKCSILLHFTTISLCVLDEPSRVHLLAVMKSAESYEMLAPSCADVFTQINDLISKKHIIVEGKQIKFVFYLTADMKFLLLVLDRSGATSKQ